MSDHRHERPDILEEDFLRGPKLRRALIGKALKTIEKKIIEAGEQAALESDVEEARRYRRLLGHLYKTAEAVQELL